MPKFDFDFKFNKEKIAYILIALGLVALASNTNLLSILPSFIWLTILSVASLGFFFASSSTLALAARISGVAGLFVVALATSGKLIDVVPLLFIAISFLITYFNCRRCWWAIIPTGVFSSLATMVFLEIAFPRWGFESIFLLGLSATFTILYLLPAHKGGKRWSIYPAIFWIFITVISNDPGGRDDVAWVLPLVLIVGGGLILWYWKKTKKE